MKKIGREYIVASSFFCSSCVEETHEEGNMHGRHQTISHFVFVQIFTC